MATRALIGKLSEESTKFDLRFKAVYHHWDGYPVGLGKTLWKLFHGHFKQDMKAMIKYLIEDHPEGWSTINNADFNYEPTFDSEHGPRNYDRDENDGAGYVTESGDNCGAEWAYILNPEADEMYILRFRGWNKVATVNFQSEEPDWDKIG